jgi:hypothetical protein
MSGRIRAKSWPSSNAPNAFQLQALFVHHLLRVYLFLQKFGMTTCVMSGNPNRWAAAGVPDYGRITGQRAPGFSDKSHVPSDRSLNGTRFSRIIKCPGASGVVFGIVGIIMKLAPIGAFGAMAFTIGKYGVGTLVSLGHLMIAFYITCLIFVLFVLGAIAWFVGFNILKFIKYIKEELLIVLGTSSSESVLPRMMAKLENLGCKESVVGLVVPTGYSFNLDGTCIYLTMAAIFLAQATNTESAREPGRSGRPSPLTFAWSTQAAEPS